MPGIGLFLLKNFCKIYYQKWKKYHFHFSLFFVRSKNLTKIFRRKEVITIKKINNNFKDFYYLTESGEVYNSKTNTYLKPDKHKYKLSTIDGKAKSISIKKLYMLVYNKIFCIDNIQNQPGEVWKEIPGTDGNYFCSNQGRVKSYAKYEAIIVKPYITEKNYERIHLRINGEVYNKFVHRLVAECFFDKPKDSTYQLHHINGNSRDNNISNLVWLSPEEHQAEHNRGKIIKHVVSFSGGKDSTAMLLRMLEEEKQIDEIIFADTSKDFPEMKKHLEKVQRYIKEKYNKDITILKAEKSFDYYMFDHVKVKGKNQGQKGYGWATINARWCTKALKTNIIDKYIKDKYRNCIIKQYVGIAYDEQKRIKDKCYPLIDWQMTELDCLNYCYDRGFDWCGLYEKFDRLSCWCCPLQNLKALRVLYKEYPHLWEELKQMDKRSINQFRADYSVEQLEQKFKKELENKNNESIHK